MTLMLASVTDADEAEIALARGADIIDLKDPSKGALGALVPAAVRAAVMHVAGRRPVSAVLGDPHMGPQALATAVEAMIATGVDYVKVGLFPGEKREDCIDTLASVARRCKIVGVMFADRGADLSLVSTLAKSGFAGAMLDTAGKDTGRLLDHADIASLRDFVAACRRHDLLSGLAGSLEAPDVSRLLLLAPDYLGFRGALCGAAGRTGRIDREAVTLIRELIPRDTRGAWQRDEPAVDYNVLAARGYAFDPDDGGTTDRVFVRDFVLPVHVGAYVHEHGRPQNVRFNIDVEVMRPRQTVEDMRDVFSYDIIVDGIRIIAAHGHVPLVETLAEEIAALILAQPRAVRATIRIEKLEAGPGCVGVEIRRERPASTAQIHHLFPAARVGGQNAAE
jgi:dihydroneopterin aldolase